jgi:hypothetical protein
MRLPPLRPDAPLDRQRRIRHRLGKGDDVRFKPAGKCSCIGCRCGKPRDAVANAIAQVCHIDGNNLSIANLEHATHDHVGDRGGIGAGHQLIDRVGIGNEIDMAKVEQRQIGAGALLDSAAGLESRGPVNIRAPNEASRIACNMLSESEELAPSVASPTLMPRSSIGLT